jgi:hypothetical protein
VHDDDTVESEPRLGAVLGDELVDGVLVDSARSWRAEAIENCRFTMIQVWQAEHSATVIRLNLLLAHDDGLLMPQDWNYGRTPGLCKYRQLSTSLEGFERYRLFSTVVIGVAGSQRGSRLFAG